MFTDNERSELVRRLMLVLAKQESDDAEMDLRGRAELLADEAREFLKGRYNTSTSKAPDGIVQTRDTLTNEDFGR